MRLGVASLKIEGRLKTPEYVANITRVYRAALDKLAITARSEKGAPPSGPSAAGALDDLVAASRYDLEMAFSRGLYTGWFGGINNQELVHGRFGKKRGVYLGRVTRVLHGEVAALLERSLKPGDGVVFDAGQPEEKEEGGRVYSVEKRGRETLLTFGRGDIDFRRLHPGDKLWKTSDPELERRLRQSFSGDLPRFQRGVDLEAHGRAGRPLTVVARDEVGRVVKVDSVMPLAEAAAQPLTTERLEKHLGRLGGTPYKLGRLLNSLEGRTILPFSELNRLRREWVSQLDAMRAAPHRWTVNDRPDDARTSRAATTVPADPELIVLVRTLPQLEAALQCDVLTLYCEFEDPKKYREAVERFRQWQFGHARRNAGANSEPVEPDRSGHDQGRPFPGHLPSAIYVAPPRISKPGEGWILKLVRSAAADGYLVRNYDHLREFSDCRCVGDYSLNVANALAAEFFQTRFALERVTASYDLDPRQLEALLGAARPGWLEITIHQHMPMFHMEHCVFCAFLSKGTDYTNCGRPCDVHEVELKDRVGARHPVKADAGCRNTVFNAIAQTGAEHLSKLRDAGARFFRVEFLNETPEMVGRTIQMYQKLLAGQISGAELWRELKLLNQLGVTRGPKPKD